MFRVGSSYYHKRMLDAGILVVKCFRDIKGRYHLKVRWVNQRGMDLCINERVTVKAEDAKNWIEFK